MTMYHNLVLNVESAIDPQWISNFIRKPCPGHRHVLYFRAVKAVLRLMWETTLGAHRRHPGPPLTGSEPPPASSLARFRTAPGAALHMLQGRRVLPDVS